jgi:ABC-2 type transport system permease protein
MDPLRLATPSPTVPARHPSAAAALATAASCEWRLVRGDAGWWAAIALLLGCLALAGATGRARVAERARAVADAHRDEARRLAALTAGLGRIERGEAKPPDAPYRDPRNALYVGRGQGATVAALPDAPLALAAVGVSDLYPQVLKVSAGSKDTFLFLDEIENPAHLLGGSFDLAFVIVYLLPLLILATGYDVLSGERERGTLAMTAATSAPLPAVLLGKLLVRAGGVALAAIVGLGAVVAVAGGRAAALPALATLAALVAVYAAFWAGLCLAVNARGRDSAANAVTLVMAWGVLLVVGPAAVNAAAQALYPAPSRAELVLAVREAAVDAERDRDAADARYRAEHPDATATATAPGDDRTARALEVTLAADARADAMLADQEARVRRQRLLADRLALVLPACLVHDAVAELAGNGHTRWDDYLARVAAFHARWRAFFVAKSRAGAGLTVADYDRFPRFEAVPTGAGPGPAGASRRRVATAGLLVALAALALHADAARRLARPS